jgi:hypothetical protein
MATDGSRRIDGGMQPKPAIFALSRASIARGTGSSNPSPSSGESCELSVRQRQSAFVSGAGPGLSPLLCTPGAEPLALRRPECARVLEVRIHLPPAKSLLRTRFLMGMGFRNAVFRSYGAQPIAGPSSSPTIRPSRRSCWGSGGSPLSWTASCGRCASALSRTPSARRSAASQCRRVTAEAAGPYFLSAR